MIDAVFEGDSTGESIKVFQQFTHAYPVPRISVLFSQNVIGRKWVENGGPAQRWSFAGNGVDDIGGAAGGGAENGGSRLPKSIRHR